MLIIWKWKTSVFLRFNEFPKNRENVFTFFENNTEILQFDKNFAILKIPLQFDGFFWNSSFVGQNLVGQPVIVYEPEKCGRWQQIRRGRTELSSKTRETRKSSHWRYWREEHRLHRAFGEFPRDRTCKRSISWLAEIQQPSDRYVFPDRPPANSTL